MSNGKQMDLAARHAAGEPAREIIDSARPMSGSEPGELWEPPTPLGRSPVPAFPADVLPSPLREFVAAVASSVQVPADLPALLSLAAVAACVQRRYVVAVRDGYMEPLSLFVAVTMAPGERKSAVMEVVTRPIADWEHDERGRCVHEVEERRERRKAEEKRLERLRDAAARAGDAEARRALIAEAGELATTLVQTPEPVYPRVLADDVTPEALARLMADHEERMSVFSAEGGIFETMAGRYSNGAPNLDVFLKGHAGDWLRVDRRSGPPVTMGSPALTMGLAVQPDVLRSIADKPGFRGRGLLARWLYALPASRVGHRSAHVAPVAVAVLGAYGACLRRLLGAPASVGGEAARLTLSRGALATWHGLAERVEVRMRPGADLAHVLDWAGKAPGLAARLAGVIHLAAGAAGPVEEPTMCAAVTIVERYAIPHALAAFGEMGADPELDAARGIIEWAGARDLDEFSAREAHRGLRGQSRFARAEAVQRACDVAEQHGHLRRLPDRARSAGTSGRPPGPRYALVTAGACHGRNRHNGQKDNGGADSVHFGHNFHGGAPSGPEPWSPSHDDGVPPASGAPGSGRPDSGHAEPDYGSTGKAPDVAAAAGALSDEEVPL
jgi:replicative DNA helicase